MNRTTTWEDASRGGDTLGAAGTTAGTTAPAAITCENIVQTFGSVRAVDDVSLTVPAGSVTALLGPNGAGKTTLMDVILGLVPPRSGQVRIFGMPVHKAIRSGYVGATQQSLCVPDNLTVNGLFKTASALWETRANIREIIDLLQLQGLLERKVKKLSGGERQRVHTALALLPNPSLLCLDEPTTGMDVTARHAFWEIMHTLAASGRTILFATHYLEEAQNFADQLVILGRGRVLAIGTPEEIQRRAIGQLRATVPDASRDALNRELAAAATAANRNWHVSFDADGVILNGTELDDAARIVLATEGAHNLTIVPASLDQAFSLIVTEDRTRNERGEVR